LQFKEGLRKNEKTTLLTWTVTMNQIQECELGLLEIKIIRIISYFEPDNIPIRIFDKLLTYKPGFIAQIFYKSRYETETRLNGAVSLLKKYSLVNGKSSFVSVHRLVQKVIRLSPKPQDILSEGITLLQNFINPNSENNDLVHSLLPHASSVWRFAAAKHPKVARKFRRFKTSLEEKVKFFTAPIWFDVEKPVDPFIEREEDLESLHLFLNPEDGISPLATILSGPEGSGKTQLARKYAKVYSEFYGHNAIWLDGRSLNLMKHFLRQLATSRLAIPKKAEAEMSIQELYQRVCDHLKKRQKKWLLVLDNVWDFDVFRDLSLSEELPNLPC
jgi:hypothetical protein